MTYFEGLVGKHLTYIFFLLTFKSIQYTLTLTWYISPRQGVVGMVTVCVRLR